MTLRWKLKQIGYDDPEDRADIEQTLLHLKVFDAASGFSSAELSVAWLAIGDHEPELDDAALEMIGREHKRLDDLVANPRHRKFYKHLGGMVDGEWRWFTSPPKPQPTLSEVRERARARLNADPELRKQNGYRSIEEVWLGKAAGTVHSTVTNPYHFTEQQDPPSTKGGGEM
jgi:hypothetical protein